MGFKGGKYPNTLLFSVDNTVTWWDTFKSSVTKQWWWSTICYRLRLTIYTEPGQHINVSWKWYETLYHVIIYISLYCDEYFSKVKVPVFTPTILLQCTLDFEVLGQKYREFFESWPVSAHLLMVFDDTVQLRSGVQRNPLQIPFKTLTRPGQETINMGGNNYRWTNDGFDFRLQVTPRSKQG